MIVKLALGVRNARSTELLNAIDADANPGYVQLYTSPMPNIGGDAITTQTLIGTCTFSQPAGMVANGQLTWDAINNDLAADNSGDIAWARFFDGAGTWVMDGDCGLTGSDALLEFNSLSVIAGGLIEIISGYLIEGGA